jgi:hypothetical protein
MNIRLSLALLRKGIVVRAGDPLCKASDGELPPAGPGTRMAADGQRLTAMVDGLAIVDAWNAWVYPATIIEQHIGVSRPLTVAGNVIILGDLGMGAQISAGGSVGVKGRTASARVKAAGMVVLSGDCENSMVQCGVERPGLAEAHESVRDLAGALDGIAGVMDQLQLHPAFQSRDLKANLGPLLQTLVERNFREFPVQVSRALKALVHFVHMGGAIEELIRLLVDHFAEGKLLSVTKPVLTRANRLVRESAALFREEAESRPTLTVAGWVRQSKLHASGSVEIREGVCQTSTVEAGVGVTVEREIVGCKVKAGESIQAASASGGGTLELQGMGQVPLAIAVAEGPTGWVVRLGRVSARFPLPLAPVWVRQANGHLELGPNQEVPGDAG